MSDTKKTETGTDKLVHGYNTVMEKLSEWAEKADENAGPMLINGLRETEEFLHGLGDWTKEEVDLISRYVKRDLHDTAVRLEKSNTELKEWLQFDFQQVEDKILDVFSNMTDRTRAELSKLSHLAEEAQTWHTGEVTSVGTIQCQSCGKEMHFHKPGRIPPCPKCHKTLFTRTDEKFEDISQI